MGGHTYGPCAVDPREAWRATAEELRRSQEQTAYQVRRAEAAEDARDALAAELEALRRVVRTLARQDDVAWDCVLNYWTANGTPVCSLPAALRAAGDEPGAAAVEAALRGGT